MYYRTKAVLTTVISALALVACEGMMGKKDDGATTAPGVEERSTTGAPDAQSRGLDGPSVFQGHPLDDPASLLSKRTIYFEFDSAEIAPEDREFIEAHSRYLADRPTAEVTLEGHADERGSREYNVALGEQRANAVRRLMGLLGASDQQIRTISYGEERPAALGHDESAWALNRRVEIDYRVR